VTQYFEEMSISAPTPLNTELTNSFLAESESESFLTSLDESNDTKSVINLLADKAFKHQFTSEDSIIVPTIESFIYTSSTESRYDDREFKGILIDSNAATRSTGGVGQFKALQRLTNDTIQLNKITAESANFTFDIDFLFDIKIKPNLLSIDDPAVRHRNQPAVDTACHFVDFSRVSTSCSSAYAAFLSTHSFSS
jgi:hypothetical protein